MKGVRRSSCAAVNGTGEEKEEGEGKGGRFA